MIKSLRAVSVVLPKEGHDVAGEEQLLVLVAPALGAHSSIRHGIDQRLKSDFRPTLVT